MTDIALDEKALASARKAGDDAYMASEENAVDDAIVASIRAYLRASPSQVAPQPQAGEPAEKPYAYEFGRSNGDDTFSVFIERSLPAKPHPDWPIKPLYASPQPANPAQAICKTCGQSFDLSEPHDCPGLLSANPAQVTDAPRFGWKCNNCKTVFTSDQMERRDENNGGPNCPHCKAYGQYTYRYNLHEGDPCIHCGTSHDEVAPGPCTAAIGAGGQAVAEAREHDIKALIKLAGERQLVDGVTLYDRSLLKSLANALEETLSQPHPADERVVEALRECASEGCCKPASVHFVRGGIGSYYCHDCYMRVQALAKEGR